MRYVSNPFDERRVLPVITLTCHWAAEYERSSVMIYWLANLFCRLTGGYYYEWGYSRLKTGSYTFFIFRQRLKYYPSYVVAPLAQAYLLVNSLTVHKLDREVAICSQGLSPSPL